jgi:putative sterol carrier protein
VAVFNGSLNAVAAYMSGRVQVDGDVTAIMNLLSFFEMPRG